jgi:hypothetical protein
MRTLEERRAALKRRGALPELDRRREATQATADRFKGKTLDWKNGLHCVRMLHSHLREMGWRSPKLPTLPRVRSALAARQALKARGWDSVTEMLDSLLEPIPAAKMRLGDVAVTPGQEGLDCVMINLGPRTMMGFHPETGEVVAYATDYSDLTRAWRVR